MGRCTWSDGKGSWGIRGVELAALPPGAYGALCRLHDIEKVAEEINTGGDQPGYDRDDLIRELLGLCGVDRTIDFIAEAVAEKGDREHPATNADRIRAMSDEELAAVLECPNEMCMAEIPCDHSDGKDCYQCLLDWLKQAEEE